MMYRRNEPLTFEPFGDWKLCTPWLVRISMVSMRLIIERLLRSIINDFGEIHWHFLLLTNRAMGGEELSLYCNGF